MSPKATKSPPPLRLCGGKLTLSRCALLALQLLLQLVEEAPVGALGEDLLGSAFNHAGLVQPQGVEAHGILGVVLTPLGVRNIFHGLEGIVVPVCVALVHEDLGHPLWLDGTD